MRVEIPVDTTPVADERRFALRAPGRLGVILAMLAAVGCFAALPGTTFQTHSMLIVDGGTAPLQSTLIRIAADGAVSKPVIDRAAGMLLASDIKAPGPDLAERLSVTAGAKGATSRQARLADSIAPVVRAEPGVVPGTLEISAAAPVPEEAARIADALADAFVTQQDDAATQARMRQDEKASARVDGAKAAALLARQRLIALGDTTPDPAQTRSAAAAQTVAAETRLASIRAIMASGSPPLSDRKDLPPALAMPQAVYLDLKGQLEKQSETLGERHTIIIALQEGVRRAATTLAAEWNRLKKIAEADVVAAREHEAAIRKGDTPIDTKRRDAIEDARRAVQIADDVVVAARRQQDVVPDEATFRMVARAPVPKLARGHALMTRLMVSLLAGCVGLALAIGLRRLIPRRAALVPRPAADVPPAVRAVVPATRKRVEPEAAPAVADAIESKARRSKTPEVAPPPMPVAASPVLEQGSEGVAQNAPARSEPLPMRRPAPPPVRPTVRPRPEHMPRSVVAPVADDGENDLVDAMRGVLDAIEAIRPRGGVCPTIMVAANEDGLGTTSVALALGRAAADRRWHVLLVEAERAAPVLAAAADLDAEPVLIDLYGTLRVGLVADGASSLTLAPVLRDASRLASNLAMNPLTPLIDDLASAYDIVVIDGGVAEDAVAAGWTSDAFVRVASRPSRRDDDVFCATFEVAGTARLATILPSGPTPEPASAPTQRHEPRLAPAPSIKAGTWPLRPRAQPAPVATASAAVPRRRFAMR